MAFIHPTDPSSISRARPAKREKGYFKISPNTGDRRRSWETMTTAKAQVFHSAALIWVPPSLPLRI